VSISDEGGIMEVLALIGSPRKGGNTDIMADELLRGAGRAGAATSKIYLDDHLVRPIGEVCDNSREREDPRSDDDFPALLERFLSADVVVWSTPVYWQGPSAQMKCFLLLQSATLYRAIPRQGAHRVVRVRQARSRTW
jgi:multimeric flavodoxin WrbA